MERTPQQGGEIQAELIAPEPFYEESHDERVIRQSIEAALLEQREIDDRTARYIASQLHEGQASALYSLTSSGAIAEEVHGELARDYEQLPRQVQHWVNWLRAYCNGRDDKGPVAGWAASAAAIDREEDEAQARVDLMERISAAGVATLGRVATIATAESVPGELGDEDDEHDVFSWGDAVRWQPDGGQAELSLSRLDELFAEVPDEVLGSVQDIGWYGLLRREGLPGILLSQNGYGHRRMREIATDEELTAAWADLQREYDAFTDATRAHNNEAGDRETESEHNPEIWVGSLSDYNDGRLHGVWLDATLEPDELKDAVAFMLRNSYSSDAEEWAIMDYDDFCGLNLGEYESLEVVSRIAQGIAEHGEPFARWAEYVGERSEEALARFEDHYLGKYDSAEAYAEYILEETDSYRYLDEIPEGLRVYAKFDTEMMGRDMEIELHVAEAGDGGILVFDPRG